MIIHGHRLGIQSWCLRNYKATDDVLRALGACGLDAIELCPVHLQAADGAAVDAALGQYADRGVAITSFGVVHITTDEAAARPFFELGKKAGFTTLGVSPAPEAFPLIERLCAEYGMRAAIHNHGPNDRWGRPEALDVVFNSSSPAIGLCLDTGWMIAVGGDPIEAVHRYAGRLYGVHLKDFVLDENGAWEDVILGTGKLNLPALLQALDAVGFAGYTTLEYEGEADNPIPSIKRCIAELHNA
ncbi:MAG: sugar phosphate isomerase/epimerase family protein [Armatimonadota bacterium]